MPIYQIIKEYLEIILNWPFLGAVLIFWFIFYYKVEIRKILSKARLNKIGNAEFGQIDIEETIAETANTASTSTSSPNWELMYYGKVVAINTMKSLLWLNNMGASTRVNFFQNMIYPLDYPDIPAEKEAQFSIMLTYMFIEQDGELYKVSSKGKKLLEYYRFI